MPVLTGLFVRAITSSPDVATITIDGAFYECAKADMDQLALHEAPQSAAASEAAAIGGRGVHGFLAFCQILTLKARQNQRQKRLISNGRGYA